MGVGRVAEIELYLCCLGNAFAEDFDLEVTQIGMKLPLISSASHHGTVADVLTVTDILLRKPSHALANASTRYARIDHWQSTSIKTLRVRKIWEFIGI